MKQTLLALLAISFLSFTACKPNHDEMKKQFMKSCEEGAARSDSGVDKEAMHQYCECSADKVFSKLSDDELIAFNKMSAKEREEKLMPIVQSCFDELQKKAGHPAAGTDINPGDSTVELSDSTGATSAY